MCYLNLNQLGNVANDQHKHAQKESLEAIPANHIP